MKEPEGSSLDNEQKIYFQNLIGEIGTALEESGRFEKEFSSTDIGVLLSIAVVLGLKSKEAQSFQLKATITNTHVTIKYPKLRFSGKIQIAGIKNLPTNIVLMAGSVNSEFIEFENASQAEGTGVPGLRLNTNPRLLLSPSDLDSALNLSQLSSLAGTANPGEVLNEQAYKVLQSPHTLLFHVIQETLQPKDSSVKASLGGNIKLDPDSMGLSVTPNNTVRVSLRVK